MVITYDNADARGYAVVRWNYRIAEWYSFVQRGPSDCSWIVPGTFTE